MTQRCRGPGHRGHHGGAPLPQGRDVAVFQGSVVGGGAGRFASCSGVVQLNQGWRGPGQEVRVVKWLVSRFHSQ